MSMPINNKINSANSGGNSQKRKFESLDSTDEKVQSKALKIVNDLKDLFEGEPAFGRTVQKVAAKSGKLDLVDWISNLKNQSFLNEYDLFEIIKDQLLNYVSPNYEELDRLYEYGKNKGYTIDLEQLLFEYCCNSMEDLSWFLNKGEKVPAIVLSQWNGEKDDEPVFWDMINCVLEHSLKNRDFDYLFEALYELQDPQLLNEYIKKSANDNKFKLIYKDVLQICYSICNDWESLSSTLELLSKSVGISTKEFFETKLATGYPVFVLISNDLFSDYDLVFKHHPEVLTQVGEENMGPLEYSVRYSSTDTVRAVAAHRKEELSSSASNLLYALLNRSSSLKEVTSIISFLIEETKLDLNLPYKEGSPPLHFYLTRPFTPNTGVLELLLRLGAQPWVRNANGDTAVALCLKRKDTVEFARTHWFSNSATFKKYNSVIKKAENTNLLYTQFVNALTSWNLICEGTNPLKVAALLDHRLLSSQLNLNYFLVGNKDNSLKFTYDSCLLAFREKYPLFDAREFIENRYLVNLKADFPEEKRAVSAEEQQFDIDQFADWFDIHYKQNDPERRKVLLTLLHNTKNRIPGPIILDDPDAPKVAPEQAVTFYEEFEKKLKQIGYTYANQPKKLESFFSKFLPELDLCLEAWVGVARQECTEIDDRQGGGENLKKEFMISMRSFFNNILLKIAPSLDQAQSIHSYHYLLKTLGKKLKLPESEISYEDVYGGHYASQFPNVDLISLFYQCCTPAALIEHAIAFFDPENSQHTKRLGIYLRDEIGSSHEKEKYDRIRKELENETSPDCLKKLGIVYHPDKGIVGSVDADQKMHYIEDVALDEDLKLTRQGALDLLLHFKLIFHPESSEKFGKMDIEALL